VVAGLLLLAVAGLLAVAVAVVSVSGAAEAESTAWQQSVTTVS
jgi:hypothetical protein